jgi:hypothetical protein
MLPTRPGLARDTFLDESFYPNRPVFVPGAAGVWPALIWWTDSYLKETCGAVGVDVMMDRDGASMSDKYAGKRLAHKIRFDEYVDLASSGAVTNKYYLVAKDDFFAAPETRLLGRDIGTIGIANTDCDSAQVKIWFGPTGTRTPLHYDSRSSVLVQGRGKRQVRAVPPWYSARMRQRGPMPARITGSIGMTRVKTECDIRP